MSRRRDTELGALLRRLEVPDHAPGFFERLELELQRQPPPPIRRRAPFVLRPSFAAGVAILLAIVLIGTWIGVPGQRFGGPTVATAAELEVRIAQAFATSRTVEGVVDLEQLEFVPDAGLDRPLGEPPGIDDTEIVSSRYRFAATENGDVLFEIVADNSRFPQLVPRGEAYFADDGSVREFQGRQPEAAFRNTPIARIHEPLGFSGEGPLTFPVKRSLGSVVRVVLRQNPEEPVEEVVHRGRPAWRLELPVNPEHDLAADRQEIVVDRQTGFPVLVTETRRGRLVRRTSVTEIRVNQAAFTDLFAPVPPGDAWRQPYERVPLEAAPARLGYRPFLPGSVPEKYRRRQVSVAKEAQANSSSNPLHRDLFQAAYRRGLDSFVVSVWRTGPDRSFWSDPVRSSSQGERGVTRVRLEGGAFDGVRAEVQVGTGSAPHIWFVADAYVVSVAGDLTRQELVEIAESLEVQS